MNVQITSRKFKCRDSLKEFITNELKTLEKYNDEILESEVILHFTHVKDSIKTAEINLTIPGKVFSASEESPEFEKSVTLAVEKIKSQLKKIKSKRLTRVK
ncbi:MAG: ribosome-associated translation inhibitor RaiA [Melioribacteraceae bacterium]|nr:ribosome-associated translation inhibitor RaiA [Melioribacteraceae bacterium]